MSGERDAADHPAADLIAAIKLRLPAQVVTLTADNGATIDMRLMDADLDPIANRILSQVLHALANRCPQVDEKDRGVWRETDLRVLGFTLDAIEAAR